MQIGEIREKVRKIAVESNMKEMNLKQFAELTLNTTTMDDILTSVEEDKVVYEKLSEGKQYDGKDSIRRLSESAFFAALGLGIADLGKENEAEMLFKRILNRTPEDTLALNNYGAIILNNIARVYFRDSSLENVGERLQEAKKAIYMAWEIDKAKYTVSRVLPAYYNLCFTRLLEAIYYVTRKETFTAFIMGWSSIEMSLGRLWCEMLAKALPYKEIEDDLMGRNSELWEGVLPHIIGSEGSKKLLHDLETLRKKRNKLIHCKDIDAENHEITLCIKTAYTLITLKKPSAPFEITIQPETALKPSSTPSSDNTWISSATNPSALRL